MVTEDTDSSGNLPEGENDPNLLYIAVGRAIHAWEVMEVNLAHVFAALTGLPENPYALSEYGSENRRLVDRIGAIKQAASAYFIRTPCQALEGELDNILADVTDSRSRGIGLHMAISPCGGKLDIPATRGPFEVTATMLYRWGAPFYSMVNLRTDPVGTNSAAINAVHDQFEEMQKRILAFNARLPKVAP